MKAKIKFTVRKLDNGFVVNENGKETAIENQNNLESHFISRFKNELQKPFNRLSLEECIISLEID